MLPYIGANYVKDDTKKILLIAESHYLPKYSEIHKNSKVWYNSNQGDLNLEEIHYINTRRVMEAEWNTVSDIIFRELDKKLSEFVDTSKGRAMTYTSFMNCFQRPANEGDSIKDSCVELDLKISFDTVNAVIEAINPDIIIFTSKYAWDSMGWKIANESKKNRIFDFVCHPGTGGLHWHRKNYNHGASKFIEILTRELIDLIKTY